MARGSVTAEVIFPSPCKLGEGSLWDVEQQVLYWVDIVDNKVCMFDPRNRSNLAFDVGESVGTVVVAHREKLVLALRTGFAWLDRTTGRVTKIHDPEADSADTRFNDGKCDPQGRFWAGTMVEGGPPERAALYCLGPDLSVSKHLDGVTTSNGLVWTRDGRTFYYIDTPTHRVDRFDFDGAMGTLGHRQVAVQVARELGAPDGMAIDENDRLWIALFGGNRVICVDPGSDRIEFEVNVPATNVTSCAFGGPELDDLYITTARVGLSPEALAAEPLAGSLFRAKVPARGVPAVRYSGDL
jgi:sugar lactone lactonase YvrE